MDILVLVLGVEAESNLRRSLEFSLELLGHTVVTVESLDDARQELESRSEPFPLVLLGSLPEEDAGERWAGCRMIRETAGGRDARILALAPRAEPATIVAALDAGVDGYLGLPLEPAEMRAQIDRAALRQARHMQEEPSPLRADAALAADRTTLPEAVLRAAHGCRIAVDLTGKVSWADSATEAVLGRGVAGLIASSIFPLVHPDDAAGLLRLLTAGADGIVSLDTSNGDVRLLTGTGDWREFDVRATSLLDEPEFQAILLELHDISHRRERENQALWQTVFDPQTGLPHRGSFQLYLNHALARADRRGESVVMMFMDLDDLSRVNTEHGRAAGDQVLTTAASRLRSSLRATDTAARIGGDEFTILLEDVASEAEAVAIAERIIREVGAPYELAGFPSIAISASLGVAFSYPRSRRGGTDLGPDGDSQVDALLRRADMALSRAKALGKARWELFSARSVPALGAL
jgi:diguanylate cyclase (GGDEF)-like protein